MVHLSAHLFHRESPRRQWNLTESQHPVVIICTTTAPPTSRLMRTRKRSKMKICVMERRPLQLRDASRGLRRARIGGNTIASTRLEMPLISPSWAETCAIAVESVKCVLGIHIEFLCYRDQWHAISCAHGCLLLCTETPSMNEWPPGPPRFPQHFVGDAACARSPPGVALKARSPAIPAAPRM